MQLSAQKQQGILLISAKGRLDASWADYFTETLLNHVRRGEHHIVLDAEELSYLSSAGIRSLMILYKELLSVQGSFKIIHATDMVLDTLKMSGFEQWLADNEEHTNAASLSSSNTATADAVYILDASAKLKLQTINAWQPWHPVNPEKVQSCSFGKQTIGIGIGGAGTDFAQARDHCGEFAAIHGHVAIQPPSERGRPDFLLAEQQFVPALQCIEACICTGDMAHHIRFRGNDEQPEFSISTLLQRMFAATGTDEIGFVIMGEIEGMVGAHLIRSPGLLTHTEPLQFPAIRDWLSFCGERVFAKEQALITGIAAKGTKHLPPLPSCPEIGFHAHAVVFPYQPIPNGCINLSNTIARFFNGPPPRAVLHLVDDQRPGNGLGESALFNGACWCAPICRKEEDTP